MTPRAFAKWVNGLNPSLKTHVDQGVLIHSGDGGIRGRGEGRGALAVGRDGAAWLLAGSAFSKKSGIIPWRSLRDFQSSDSNNQISIGYEEGSHSGRVTFLADRDRSPSSGSLGMGLGARVSFRREVLLLAQKELPEEGWEIRGEDLNWYRPRG